MDHDGSPDKLNYQYNVRLPDTIWFTLGRTGNWDKYGSMNENEVFLNAI